MFRNRIVEPVRFWSFLSTLIALLTVGSSLVSSRKVRLRDTLAVFPTGGPGVAPPLWVGIDAESALAAASGVTTPDAEGVVEGFRRDVENARNRVKK